MGGPDEVTNLQASPSGVDLVPLVSGAQSFAVSRFILGVLVGIVLTIAVFVSCVQRIF